MSFGKATPESLLPRSDSKNPATTCKGMTANGRSCRRALVASPSSSPTPSPRQGRGVLAVLRDEDLDGNKAAAFYCWQHKCQAEQLLDRDETQVLPVKDRSSLDTLIDRMGVVELDDECEKREDQYIRGKRKEDPRVAKRDTLPAGWNDMPGPLMALPAEFVHSKPEPRMLKGRSRTKASVFCCVTATDDDDMGPARRHLAAYRARRVVHSSNGTQHPASEGNDTGLCLSHRTTASHKVPSTAICRDDLQTTSDVLRPDSTVRQPSSPTATTPISVRPLLSATPQSTASHTKTLLSLIPPALSPHTTSVLLDELSKPLSPADGAGYIYMFWLTPDLQGSKPDDYTASSLLAPLESTLAHDRHASNVLQRFASKRRTPASPPTVLLKIGRAANVHRRLRQWSKQCAHNITLIRFYPYTASARLSIAKSAPRKVPHVHRVERLIHVELAEKRVIDQGPCQSCGREHREWFEIEASRRGLKAVDEIIRRWVEWSERQL